MSDKWTRDDMPAPDDLVPVVGGVVKHRFFWPVLDAFVDHLNDHHPKQDASRIRNLEWEVAEHSNGARRAVNERDVMRRERDAVAARAEQAETRGDDWEQRAHEWMKLAEKRADVTRDDIASALERTDADTSHGDEVTYTDMANAVCDLLGIEAEQAVDPVEAKAREITQGIGVDWDFSDDEFIELMTDVARHVLGQEAGSDE